MSDLIFPSLVGVVYAGREPFFANATQTSDAGRRLVVRRQTAQGWRFNYDVRFLRTSLYEHSTLQSFFRHHAGSYDSFLVQIPEDYSVTGHGFGMGDGASTKFQLQRGTGGYYTDKLGTWPQYHTPRSNYATRSEDFSHGDWVKNAGGGGTVTVSANAAIAPDGTITADALTFPAADTTIYQGYGSSVSVGQAWTFSVWLKGTAAQTCRLVLDTAGGTYEFAQTAITLTGSWQRASVTLTIANTSHTGMGANIKRNVGDTVTTVSAWGAQLELDEGYAVPKAYIATTTASVTALPTWWTVNQSTSALVPGSDGTFEVITAPDMGTVTIYKNYVAQTPTTDYTFNSAGMITFGSAPANALALTWTGNYYRRVRFLDDELILRKEQGPYFTGRLTLETVVV
jgi:hypothetical protein